MEDSKLTVRVPKHLMENLKQYAVRNNTTITNLIESYLERIPISDTATETPIVQRISGTISPKANIEDYKRHLEDKYVK